MNWSDSNIISEYRNSSLLNYFKNIIPELSPNLSVDELTFFLTDDYNFRNDRNQEPAFKRRIITPSDKKFFEIYINYLSETRINSIVWITNARSGFKFNLNDLQELFGDYKTHYQFYDETTEYAFQSKNTGIAYIHTFHSANVQYPEFHYLTVSFKKE
jgi:hypothetical protein